MASIPVIDSLFSIESSVFQQAQQTSTCGTPVDACIKAMDFAGVSQILLAPCKRWRCERHWICGDIQVDEVLHFVTSAPARFAGLVGYNPFCIAESLQQLDQAIQERDFRGVYVHTEGSDVPLRDRRMYPLYARCVELNLPLVLQVSSTPGSTAAPASEIRHIFADFPDLQLVAAWYGPLDVPSLADFAERNPSASIALDGNAPAWQQSAFADFLASNAARCMWGSNGLPWTPLLDRVRSLSLPDEILTRFLHDNAAQRFNLARPIRASATSKVETIIVAER